MKRSDRVRAIRLGEAHGADHALEVADDERRYAYERGLEVPLDECVRFRLQHCLQYTQRGSWEEHLSTRQIAALLHAANPHAEALYRAAYNRGASTMAQKIIDGIRCATR